MVGDGVNQIYQANKGGLTVNMNLPVVVTSGGGEKFGEQITTIKL